MLATITHIPSLHKILSNTPRNACASTCASTKEAEEKQKTEVQACSAMVAGAPSRHVSAAFCCIVFAVCVSCNPFHSTVPAPGVT
jgi:hypothetical protein